MGAGCPGHERLVPTDERFTTTAAAAVADLLRLQPEVATALGDHRYDDRLDDLSDGGRRELHVALAGHRDALDSLDLDGLDAEDAVDAEMLRTGLDRLLLDADLVRPLEWDPLAWLPGEAIYPLLARDTEPVADRLRALASRLELVPERLERARRTVARPPLVHVETAVEQTGGIIALLEQELPALLAQEPRLRPLVEPAQATALRALRRHRAALAEAATSADGDPRLGPDVFDARLHLVLDSDLTAGQVVARAEEQLALVEDQLAELCGGPARVGAALAEVARDAPDDATIVPLASTLLADLTGEVRRLGFVSVPDAPVEVQVMPEFRRGYAVAYCDAPGALEQGGTTFFAVAPTPSDWSAERVASFYREYNSAQVANLTVHEAMPGHVLQLAHQARFRGPTVVRQVFGSGSFIEGWAVHAEELMALAGVGGRAVRLQQLKVQLRVTINALLDAGVHAGGMGESEAMALMTGRGRQEEGEAVGKWRRAQLSSCQLSTYFVGYAELAPVVAAVDRSRLLCFDPLLAHGAPPPRHLARLLAAG